MGGDVVVVRSFWKIKMGTIEARFFISPPIKHHSFLHSSPSSHSKKKIRSKKTNSIIMASIKVHGVPMSTATMRVLAALYEKDLQFELIPVDMRAGAHKKEPFLSLNVSNPRWVFFLVFYFSIIAQRLIWSLLLSFSPSVKFLLSRTAIWRFSVSFCFGSFDF